MITVGIALARSARMHMNIGHDRQATRLADRPEVAEVAPIEPDDATVERVRIEIVVEHEIKDARAAVFATPEQERPALPARMAAALTQLHLQTAPQKPGA